jgi:hypothetical protein
MADPTQFQQLSDKLDDIKDIVSKLELKLEERGGVLRDLVHTETATLRKEFNDFKTVVDEKVTATATKVGFIFSVVMIIVTGALAAYFKQ